MLNYTDKVGFEVTTGSGSERYVTLRRYRNGEFESLFIARCKYLKPGTRANRWARRFKKDFRGQECSVTQEQIDAWRAEVNAVESAAFQAAYKAGTHQDFVFQY